MSYRNKSEKQTSVQPLGLWAEPDHVNDFGPQSLQEPPRLDSNKVQSSGWTYCIVFRMLTILGDFLYKSLQFLILVQCRLLCVASGCSNKNSLLVYFVEFHFNQLRFCNLIKCTCPMLWRLHGLYTPLQSWKKNFSGWAISLDLKLEPVWTKEEKAFENLHTQGRYNHHLHIPLHGFLYFLQVPILCFK